jgi:thioredoxin-related protein
MLAAFLALGLVGCGGEEPPAETPTDAAAPAPAPAPAPAADGGAAPVADRSDLSAEVFVPFPNDDSVPAAVKERLDNNQAMLLFFYNSEQEVTDDLRAEIDKVAEDNKGLVDLLTYNVGKNTKIDAEGNVVVDPELANDENAQEAVQFAHQIGVDHLPYVVVVDEQGYEIFYSRGFIDEELLGRQVERAAQ